MKFFIPIMVEMDIGGEAENTAQEIREAFESLGRDYIVAHCTWQLVTPPARDIGGLSFAPAKMMATPLADAAITVGGAWDWGRGDATP